MQCEWGQSGRLPKQLTLVWDIKVHILFLSFLLSLITRDYQEFWWIFKTGPKILIKILSLLCCKSKHQHVRIICPWKCLRTHRKLGWKSRVWHFSLKRYQHCKDQEFPEGLNSREREMAQAVGGLGIHQCSCPLSVQTCKREVGNQNN